MRRLRNEIKKYYNEKREDVRGYVAKGYMKSWAPEHRIDADRGLKQYSTDARWNAYQAGKITREKAVELATVRALREVEENERENFEKLAEAEDAPVLGSVCVVVEWKRSETWGWNPKATATAYDEKGRMIGEYIGRASGCGYDKRSAAIAEALNQCASVIAILYTAEAERLEEVQPKGRREALGYGAGYGVMPYFEGGCGVSSIMGIMGKCGYEMRCTKSGNKLDVYAIEKK